MSAARPVTIMTRFRSAHSGAAAVEFSLILPVLVVLFLGAIELARYAAFQRNLASYVEGMAADVASFDTTVKSAKLYQVMTTVGIVIPEIAHAAPVYKVRHKVGVSVVKMTPTVANCLANCTYTAEVAWSVGDLPRNCGILSAAANQSDYDVTKLPAGVFQSGSVVVVDVITKYDPIFGSGFLSSLDVAYSAYAPVRNYTAGPYLPWAGSMIWWSGTKCAGFP